MKKKEMCYAALGFIVLVEIIFSPVISNIVGLLKSNFVPLGNDYFFNEDKFVYLNILVLFQLTLSIFITTQVIKFNLIKNTLLRLFVTILFVLYLVAAALSLLVINIGQNVQF
jgi:hypothetical protein